MSLVVSLEDIKPEHVRRKEKGPDSPASTTFPYLTATNAAVRAPSASLARYDAGGISTAHFHPVDQFQIVVEGAGLYGRHHVSSPYYVHFARAYTPYGPLVADNDMGWSFLVLKARFDSGAKRLSVAGDQLRSMANRRPLHLMNKVMFPAVGGGTSLDEIQGIRNEEGLFACTLSMRPGAQVTAPDASAGDGQFLAVLNGSLVHGSREYKRFTVAYVAPEDEAFRVHAGPQGLEALVLNFPRVEQSVVDVPAPPAVAKFKRWYCVLCGFVYDEASGLPNDGISAGTRWEDVPDAWSCPDCGVGKSDFEMVEV